ncbi:MAG TPA: S41 family peptidase [Cyclobacteriaceae bacterium]|nr:S41 family peptidase [Cyclobacteriaceae bacterium]
MKKRISLFLAVVSVAGLVAFQVPADNYFQVAKSLEIFASIFKEINTHYVDEVDPKKLVNTGIQGMLESLDPYTDYIAEENVEAFTQQMTNEYAGIGAMIGIVNKKTVVTYPYENFPAHRAGLRVGDEFIMVDGKNVRGKASSEISALLKGSPRSDIKVVVNRQGQELSFTMRREKIKINNIAYSGLVEPGVGYIKLDDFTPMAAREVEAAVTQLKQQGATKLIIDLRDNPGGILEEAVGIVGLFIPRGKEVVSTRGKAKESFKTYNTSSTPIDVQIPIAVLTSGGSASAAEIVAGSLQDYDRAVLIGQKTFGKGLVQSTVALPYNAKLKVTSAKYYIPSGRCIQALDYAHRKSNGTVEKFADSLKSSFRTANGRTVYDGGGLDPDIAIKPVQYSTALIELVQEGLIFEYASVYCNGHSITGSYRDFKLTDQDYKAFENWLQTQHFTYVTDLEKQTDELIKVAKTEKYYSELQENLQAIKAQIEQSHLGFSGRFKQEIKQLLEEEIAFHAGLNKGKAEVSFDSDPEITEARRILKDMAGYKKLLSPR